MWSARLRPADRRLARYLAGLLVDAGQTEPDPAWEAVQDGEGWTFDAGGHDFGVEQVAVDWVGVKADAARLAADPGFRAQHTA